MARRRSKSHSGDESYLTGFAERIATATKPDPARDRSADEPVVISREQTRYQRRTANLPTGAATLSGTERTDIVIDLRNQAPADE